MKMHMMIGNIGCGKSLLSSKLAKLFDAAVVNNDSLVNMFGGYDYNRYDYEKRSVYKATEETAIKESLSSGHSVVIDRTNMDLKRRARFLEIGRSYGAEIIAYDFGPESNVDRRLKSPRGVPESVWRDIYEFMKSSYEPPTLEEGFSDIIEPPKKYTFHAFDFDGTIVDNSFPAVGDIINGTVERMNALYQDLANIIIVWTCRSGDFESQVRHFLNKKKILFDFVNENPVFDTGSRKVFAHNYYDDRNALI